MDASAKAGDEEQAAVARACAKGVLQQLFVFIAINATQGTVGCAHPQENASEAIGEVCKSLQQMWMFEQGIDMVDVIRDARDATRITVLECQKNATREVHRG